MEDSLNHHSVFSTLEMATAAMIHPTSTLGLPQGSIGLFTSALCWGNSLPGYCGSFAAWPRQLGPTRAGRSWRKIVHSILFLEVCHIVSGTHGGKKIHIKIHTFLQLSWQNPLSVGNIRCCLLPTLAYTEKSWKDKSTHTSVV